MLFVGDRTPRFGMEEATRETVARLGASVAGLALVAAGMGLASTASASASPPADGCPNGYPLMSVAALSAQGYLAPAEVESPASGVVGNGSGNGQS